jgi:hypothetical protein
MKNTEVLTTELVKTAGNNTEVLTTGLIKTPRTSTEVLITELIKKGRSVVSTSVLVSWVSTIPQC